MSKRVRFFLNRRRVSTVKELNSESTTFTQCKNYSPWPWKRVGNVQMTASNEKTMCAFQASVVKTLTLTHHYASFLPPFLGSTYKMHSHFTRGKSKKQD